MKRITGCMLLLTVVFFACKSNDQNKIIGKWHAYKLENKMIDSDFIFTQKVIDTLGMGHDDATNMSLYNTSNMDSLRKALQIQHDEAFEVQKNAVKNTIFTLNTNGIAIMSFNGEVDSSKWKLTNNTRLLFSDLKGPEGADSTAMDILVLNDTLLKVRMTKETDTSVIFFRRESKS